MAIDERSEKNIQTLKPEVQPLARRLIETAREQGINAKVISGYRSYAEQDALYAKGRTAPGPRVTKARGGYSWHNFQIAFDVGIFSENGKEYLGESPDYRKVGKIGESLGLEWGGSWKDFVDEPHFQYNPNHLSLAQCRERTAERKDLLA
jgi:peptidoglycan L-alanyl-D-glutamate endopeptidase CwlK